MKSQVLTKIKVADEVWIAAALLHREHPQATDFSIEDIVDRARREGLQETLRPCVYVHVVLHCVANRPANPGRYRMLCETKDGRRRLYRKGDHYHPDREGSKMTPEPAELPAGYAESLEWYREWSAAARRNLAETDPLLQARIWQAYLGR